METDLFNEKIEEALKRFDKGYYKLATAQIKDKISQYDKLFEKEKNTNNLPMTSLMSYYIVISKRLVNESDPEIHLLYSDICKLIALFFSENGEKEAANEGFVIANKYFKLG